MARDEMSDDLEKGLEPPSPSTFQLTLAESSGVGTVTDHYASYGFGSLTHCQ